MPQHKVSIWNMYLVSTTLDVIKDDDDRGNNKNDSLVCDFDVMMQKKKDENRVLHNKRKKAKDIDMINDNDDAIAKVSKYVCNKLITSVQLWNFFDGGP